MPELPEVETVVRTLRPHLLNRRFMRIELTRSDIVFPAGCNLAEHLLGRTVTSITRRGKRIVFQLDDQNRFYVHLGMTGRLTIDSLRTTIQPHTHLIARLSNGAGQLRFRDPRRFGGIWWMGLSGDVTKLGPEALKLRPAQLSRRLLRTKRAIKNALLDQSVIAGLGNIYVDEALFHARIHPLTPAPQLTEGQIHQLNRGIKAVLRRALRHRGSTLRDYVDANGSSGNFQKLHRVYSREGEPCPCCKVLIKRIVLGGRSTHFCPNCQSR